MIDEMYHSSGTLFEKITLVRLNIQYFNEKHVMQLA